MKPVAELRIPEIGQFCLLKRALPEQTTLIYTGEDLSPVQEMDCRIFDLRLLPWLRRSLARGDWDLVFCHAPVRPLWDRRHGLNAALHGLLQRLFHLRTLGTYALHGRTCPVVMLDFNDEPCIPANVFPLLDQAMLQA